MKSSEFRLGRRSRMLALTLAASLALFSACGTETESAAEAVPRLRDSAEAPTTTTTTSPQEGAREFLEKCVDLAGDDADHEERFSKIAGAIPLEHSGNGEVALAMTADTYARDAEACGLQEEAAAYAGDVEFFSGTSIENFRGWLACMSSGAGIDTCTTIYAD